ncbi:MAG: NADH:ubiquinone reductase (Na(+)-transporting) subunit C [Parachlamydiaceae bacterium]
MSESNSSNPRSKNLYTLLFMVVLSLVCAIILSVLASALKQPQEMAKELDRSQQMLIAARILNPDGYFQVQDEDGRFIPAKFTQKGALEASNIKIFASQDEVLEVYRNRIRGFLVNEKGESTSFEKAKIEEEKYVQEFRKTGYYKEKWKLIYEIFANSSSQENGIKKERPVIGYVIPVNGMGLWDAIYGYLAIEPNGNQVIGISWYDQKETPGLGANIAEPEWQSQFPGKQIFQQSADGKTHVETAPLGLVVVKGKVKEVLANSPKSLNAVDGMAGATLTGNGVTNAYREVLAAYRPFLIKIHQEFEKMAETKRGK